MIEYTSWTISSGLNWTLIPYWSGATFWWTSNFLTWFYQFPWKFYDLINLDIKAKKIQAIAKGCTQVNKGCKSSTIVHK